jgi:hypothetical protein
MPADSPLAAALDRVYCHRDAFGHQFPPLGRVPATC